MQDDRKEKRSRVLDPVERTTEIIFGLLMALTFTGSISVATAGREEVRTMMAAALGCNLAWGFADAVLYLIAIATARVRAATLVAQVRSTPDFALAHTLIRDSLPAKLGELAGADILETFRGRLAAAPPEPKRHAIERRDLAGAFGVFLLTVLATFPVVIPFVVFDTTPIAMRVSNAVAVVTLFASGSALARYAGGRPWVGGLAVAGIGIVLVGAIIALGG